MKICFQGGVPTCRCDRALMCKNVLLNLFPSVDLIACMSCIIFGQAICSCKIFFQVSKYLDTAGAKLDYRRYAEVLFDILVAGGQLGKLHLGHTGILVNCTFYTDSRWHFGKLCLWYTDSLSLLNTCMTDFVIYQ